MPDARPWSVFARLRVLSLAICCGIAATAALGTAPALADVRSGSGGDPRDGIFHENVDGSSYYEQDIEQVRVIYDSTGSIEIVVRFYEPLPKSSGSNRMRIEVGAGEFEGSTSYKYCSGASRGDLTANFSPQTDPAQGSLSLYQLEGTIPFTPTYSADNREYVIKVAHQALAGRGYKCVDGITLGYSYESFHCTDYGCYDYRYRTTDEASPFKLFGPGAYSDEAPPQTPPATPPVTPAACADGKDNDGDGTTDTAEDYGCRDDADDDERLTKDGLPSLTKADAAAYARKGLAQGGLPVKGGKSYRGKCKSASRIRAKCSVSWSTPSASYRGPVTIWYSKAGEDVEWNYAYRITRTKKSCSRKCTKTFVVK